MLRRLPFENGENNLLNTLPAPCRDRIASYLRPVDLPQGIIIEHPDKPIEQVVFPLTGVASVLAVGPDDRRIEAGLYGREGMSGGALLLGARSTPNETIMQVPGHGLAIEAGRFTMLLDEDPRLQRHLLLFIHTMIIQTSHTALSNVRARLAERLARWLLMCHDRIDGDRLDLTHEFLAIMLGVRRAGVTEGIHILEGKKLIEANRGCVVIVNREGLEQEAAQSYGTPEAEYRRLLGRHLVAA